MVGRTQFVLSTVRTVAYSLSHERASAAEEEATPPEEARASKEPKRTTTQEIRRPKPR
jgi:hypothetical protein